jgi:hypothetical protein
MPSIMMSTTPRTSGAAQNFRLDRSRRRIPVVFCRQQTTPLNRSSCRR